MTGRNQGKSHKPVLVQVLKFTTAGVILQPLDTTHCEATELVAQKHTYLQVLSDPRGFFCVREALLASDLSGEQRADLMQAAGVIAWVPLWKVRDLGLTPMGPVVECDE